LWQQLITDTDLPDSVHLTDWPEPGKVNEKLLFSMKFVREAIATGLAQRAEAGIKVRQPLAKATIPSYGFTDKDNRQDLFKDIIAEELNVKEVQFSWT